METLEQQLGSLSSEQRRLVELWLRREQAADKRPASDSIPRRRSTDPSPLSFAQQRLWFLYQLEPASPHYNLRTAIRLTGRLDVAVLERGLNQIVCRHEALRTTFIGEEGQPRQVVAPTLHIPLPLVELGNLPLVERDVQIQRLALEETEQPFNLEHGPLLRARLLRLAPDQHVLLLTMHHIISDGWSQGVQLRELAALYAAFAQGKPAPLPDLPIQYADYARWQQDWLQGPVLDTQLAFWKEQLGHTAHVLELLTDRPRPAVATYRGSWDYFTLPASLLEGLKELSRREGVTLFMTLLAAFDILLYRYTGQTDIVVGTPVAGRNRSELEGLLGCFVNMLALRTDVSGNPPFRELLQRVRTVTLGAYAHQDLPFERLVEELHPDRDLSRNPIFQVMLALQNAPMPDLRGPGLTLQPMEVNSTTSTLDLSLYVREVAHELLIRVEYSTDLFDAATIQRMLNHFHMLLERIVAAPDQPIARLPLLTPDERQQFLGMGSAPPTPYPQDAGIHTLVEAQAARTPHAVALVYGEQQLTYAELNARANQLAGYLRARGVGPDTAVAVCLPRTADLLVALLGVLKAGGAYVPLDPNYPSERLAYMLSDSRAAVLLTATFGDKQTSRQADKERVGTELLPFSPSPLLPFSPSVVDLDADWPAIVQQPTEILASGVRPDNLAYVIYTSGSTGAPKGVAITHQNAVAFLTWASSAFAPEQLRGVLAATSVCFDLSVFELFAPLSCGGTVILADDVLQLPNLPAASQVMLINSVPSAVAALLRLGPLPPNVRGVNLAGEALPARLVEQLYQQPEVAQVTNLYGPSETTTYSTVATLPRQASSAPPIGRPIGNTLVYLLDGHMQPAPLGVMGEVYIGGAGVARGYLHRPDLTAERFVPNPFATTDDRRRTTDNGLPHSGGRWSVVGGRLYRTGDLARYRTDGQLEFLGRVDHQVKVRGYRIELGEIEAVLRKHAAVQDTVVLVREDRSADRRLVAYIVRGPWSVVRGPSSEIGIDSHSTAQPTTDNGQLTTALRGYLKQHLPEYMLPSAFMFLGALPLTPNGKVDRKALPAPDRAQAAPAAIFVAPHTPVEELLAGIMAEVLHLPRVGVADSFFDLGGHSLLATQVLARVRNAFQINISVRSLFEAPTVAELARVIEHAQNVPGLLAPPLRPAAREGALPLSFAQQRLWFLDQLAPGKAGYTIPLAVRLAGRLDIHALQQSFDALVCRHETLRTCFPLVDGQPIQLIQPPAALPLAILDLRAEPEAERMPLAQQHLRAVIQQPFDLAAGPLVRVTLMQLADDEYLALLTMHHIIADGWSIGVLLRELAALYAAFADGQPAALSELPIQYADFAICQRQWLQGEVLDTQLAYWRAQLALAPTALDLPTDHPRPPIQSFNGATHKLVLPPSLTAALTALSRKEGATLFMTLLAAFDVLLYRYSGQTDIVVGSPIAGRTHAELEGLIGCFINTLVLRSDLSGNPTFRALLARVRNLTLEAYSHQDLPFELLVEALQPMRDLSRNPLFQVMLILQKPPAGALEAPDLTIEPLEFASGAAQLDLLLSFVEQGAGLVGTLEYNTDLFDAATIARLLEHFEVLLEGIVADLDQPIATLPLLRAGERQQLLAIGMAPPTSYPRQAGIHTLIEAQAARSPSAVALVCGQQQLTYAELNARANQLARYLRERGVAAGGLVGICLERSLELVVALLGVLKAGGAYVPLDLTYPSERLAYMLSDSQAAVLLTATTDVSGDKETSRQADKQTGNAISPSRVLPFSSSPGRWSVVDLVADREAIAREPAENLERGVMPEQLAYVIYTSGSTGQPKGVQIPHRAVVNFLTSMARRPGMDAQDVLLAVTTIAFDIAGLELFLPLTVGARAVLVSREEAIDAARLRERLASSGASVMQATPATWRLLLEAGWEGRERLRMLCGGEALPGALAEQLLGLGGELWNMYGPTETTIWSTAGAVEGGAERVALGMPIANTQVYVLDGHMQPVPVGVVGELYIGGEGLAWGYRGRPELTAERFVPNPFADFGFGIHPYGVPDFGLGTDAIQNPKSKIQNGSRLYRTGDLARYRADGRLECLGRVDNQVKVRGYRIELGEVEAVLGRHAAVQDTVVVVREDTPSEQRLVAYIVPTPEPRTENGHPQGQPRTENQKQRTTDNAQFESAQKAPDSQFSIPNSQFSIQEMRAFLKEWLPEYMLPSVFVVLSALPLTPNGKVDRRALPAPARNMLSSQQEYVAPRTPAEQMLAGIWGQVLGLNSVGVQDNFFTAGGDSLLAIRLVAKINQTGTNLTLVQIYKHQTIAELAGALDVTPVMPVEQGLVTGPVPLTPGQHWALSSPTPHWLNMSTLFEIQPGLEPVLLEQAVRHLLHHHDALRARFSRNPLGDWQQVIVPPDQALTPEFVYFDWSERSEAEQRAAFPIAANQLQCGFDLAAGPLICVALFDFGPHRPGRLLVIVNHIVHDDLSMQILLQDLYTAWQQLRQGQTVRLPLKTASIKQWAELLTSYAQSAEVRQELEYWLNAPWAQAPHLPLDYPGCHENNTLASTRYVERWLSVEETEVLTHSVLPPHNAHMADLLLLALVQTITGWTGGEYAEIVGINFGRDVIGGLDSIDVSRTVGYFALNSIFILRRAEASTPAAALQAVVEQLRGIPNGGRGYTLLSVLSDDAEVRGQLKPLFKDELDFNYLGRVDELAESEGTPFRLLQEWPGFDENPENKRSLVLACLGAIIEGGLRIRWEYSDTLHRQATIEALADEFMGIVRSFMTPHAEDPALFTEPTQLLDNACGAQS